MWYGTITGLILIFLRFPIVLKLFRFYNKKITTKTNSQPPTIARAAHCKTGYLLTATNPNSARTPHRFTQVCHACLRACATLSHNFKLLKLKYKKKGTKTLMCIITRLQYFKKKKIRTRILLRHSKVKNILLCLEIILRDSKFIQKESLFIYFKKEFLWLV